MPLWLIKTDGDGIQGPLVDIINLTLETGIFPMVLKEAMVVSLLSKLTLYPTDPANYSSV